MHIGNCICPLIPRYELRMRLVLVMHRREYPKVTATGPLALEALANSELRIHGHRDRPLDFSDLDAMQRRILLLYPAEGAETLCRSFLDQDDRPVTLVVPDGNWRQASKMGRRLPGLEQTQTVRLPDGEKTGWGIRREHLADGLATFEAIARAVGIIESPAAQAGLEKLFRTMVLKTLDGRGYQPKAYQGERSDEPI